jgi:DNA primase
LNEIEEVKSRLDIVDVIGQYTPLHKAGRTFKAVCPFHSEKTPSFTVNPDRQSWHCFGACGTGGDVISFVMKREGIDFPEALRTLAERAGVKLPEKRVSEEQDRARKRLYDANEAAAAYFRSLLATQAGAPALRYLESRGIDEATAAKFMLGYSLDGWENCRDHLRGRGFSDRELLAAGLCVQGERGLYDRFRGRLTFAVWDAKGRVIGFGARAMPAAAGAEEATPKYLNTTQTGLFDKGGTLYALHLAHEAIRSEDRAVIVEGYMDVIAAHQHGFTNVVAQMGTALTERQVRLLKRLTTSFVLALDADAAGLEAAVRGHDVVREQTTPTETVNWRGLVRYQDAEALDLRVAVLPPGRDPDDVIRADPELWRSIIAGAEPVLDFRLGRAAAARDLTAPQERSRLVRDFLPLLAAVGDPVVRAHYIQRLSRLALASEDEVTSMLSSSRGEQGRGQPRTKPNPIRREAVTNTREDFLLALLLRYPHLRAQEALLSEDLLWEAQSKQLLRTWRDFPDTEAVKEAVPVELKSYVERLILWNLPISGESEASEALQDCVRKLNQRQLQAEKQHIAAQIAALQDEIGPGTVPGLDAPLHEAEPASYPPDSPAERSDELQQLLERDIEIGRQLHSRGRNHGIEPVEIAADG